MTPVQSNQTGLGNRHLLDKIDKLRELGISKQVPLPQLVVVGDQSSGKSSVLESLTGYYFPRSVGLCTRHATEIVCRREQTASIVITIHPVDATPEREELAKSFKHVLQDLKGGEFAEVLEKASKLMGIKTASHSSTTGAAFSKDILRVEICGPDEEHLTIIDVPGIFENPQEGVTTSRDVSLVKSMVKDYIKDSRTIILAVIPCNVDVATQTILTYAADVEPEGKRTLGVLTKPDLVAENATRQAVMDLVRGKRRDIQLGYYVFKNRGADDLTSSKEDRDMQEKLFFAQNPWAKLDKSRLGIPALRSCLRKLLLDRTKSEFPKVGRDINQQLIKARAQIAALGEPRGTAEEQRRYLGHIVDRFTKLVRFGLDAYYTGDPIFEDPDLRLVTRVRAMNDAFSAMLYQRGHAVRFEDRTPGTNEKSSLTFDDDSKPTDEDALTASRGSLYALKFAVPDDAAGELDSVLSEPCFCADPLDGGILSQLGELFNGSRGYDVGTFGGQMIPTAFKTQSSKWESITLAHISNVILVVHDFIRLTVLWACSDENVFDGLWSSILEDLIQRYCMAMNHAKFLLRIECEGRAMTHNSAFDASLSQVKAERWAEKFESMKVTLTHTDRTSAEYVPAKSLSQVPKNADGLQETSTSIHDVLKSYYQIARARFVDIICTQAVGHFLLDNENGPLGVLSTTRVFNTSVEQLEMIAGEDSMSKSTREMLTNDIKMLEEGKKILRG